MKKIFLSGMIALLVSFYLQAVSMDTSSQSETIRLLPKPARMEVGNGFYLPKKVEFIKYVRNEKIPAEGYRLAVNKHGVVMEASGEAGFFYGQQTVDQLMTEKGLPYVSIQDEPRFPYRGFMLDVSRHFYPKEFIFKLLDAISYYKLNTFHFHLTDGGGWRIQIDKYPELTRNAAFRDTENWNEWRKNGNRFVPEGTPGAYGGYYTKDDIREIVAYATSKHITVIPEMEMPGHSSEVFVAYPGLCCSGEAYQGEDFCIGNEDSFTFIENVLTEIIDLFPSKYIHVGGDEASKRHWRTCPKCQERMKTENFTHIDDLQSYLIKRMDKFLTAKGRKLIGWDEIMEGGLASNAAVMSWQSEAGGMKAARMGHDAVMTPTSYLYLDYYQADPPTQPFAIGGYVPVKRVYGFNPAPSDSLNLVERKHILGLQANLWTEFIPDESHVEYMAFPRLLAVAEVGWTPQEKRDWQDFKIRMNRHIPLLRQKDVHAFQLSDEIEVTMTVDTIRKEIKVILDAEKYPADIRYTTDGSMPVLSSLQYKHPIVVKDSARIVAAIFRDGALQGAPVEKKVDYHRGINKPIHYNSRLSSKYMAGGMNALLDGFRGGLTYLDGRWQGYTNDLDCVIDMEELIDIHQVSARFMQIIFPQVFQPGQVEMLTSEDGVNFTSRGVVPTTIPNNDRNLSFQEYTFSGKWKARYIRLIAKEVNKGSFIFTDEIVIW
ncbi:MAG: family 20 glycosylhydrolase [Dysgonamonadaceae bacterium]|jgi:hexosaminidase|nr:family 20 glycosylhydrolase [Dysgonamonadaceae bacterium]